MFDDRMIGIPNKAEKAMVEIDLPRNWIAHNHPAFRVADLGAPVLTYVAVLSAYEAAAINKEYKHRAEEELRKNLAEKGAGYLCQHLDEGAVAGAKQVERLLEAIEQEGYFSSWVLIESCTID